MKIIGPSVKEIRIHEKGESRVVYVAGFPEAVYILHAFRKKHGKPPGRISTWLKNATNHCSR